MHPVRFLVRVWAFVAKEITEVFHQPLLILTLVAAPFLILLLFGLGYQGHQQPLKAVVVAAPENPLRARLPEVEKPLGPLLDVKSVTGDEAQARQQLKDGKVDLVIVAPVRPLVDLKAKRKAEVTFLNDAIDPTKQSNVGYVAQVFVTSANQGAAQASVQEAQSRAARAHRDVATARATVAALRAALTAGDRTQATLSQTALQQQVDALTAAAGLFGVVGAGSSDQLRRDAAALGAAGTGASGSVRAEQTRLDRLDRDLVQLDSDLTTFQNADPALITQPFAAHVQGLATVQPSTRDYYSPAVVILLLQHLAVTFAGLSLVRERRMGAMELFRVSPLTPFQTLAGKYLGYGLLGGVIGAALTGLLVYALGVPFLGSVVNYAIVLALLLLAALGLGFVISLLARTETQAVQYAMIVLLASVFFSGFLLRLDTLSMPVRLVAWLLPATYAIRLLQDVMLRGRPPDPVVAAGLAVFGFVLLVASWVLLRRQFARL